MEHKGVIYILTNPSFPQFVKIGYADNVEERLAQLNRSECIPYAFRLYAYYKVPARLTDMKLHTLIDNLNPNLRSVEEFNGKTRKREFYAMTAAQAYSILEAIAEINGMKENLVLVEPTAEDLASEDMNTVPNFCNSCFQFFLKDSLHFLMESFKFCNFFNINIFKESSKISKIFL